MITLNCDFSNSVGPVKPMHGVNNGPIASYYNFDNFHYLTEAGIPFSRLHDTGGTFGGARFVDIWNIFTDKDADENDPASYDFTFTDLLITNLKNAGVEPFYRLGTTIENGHKAGIWVGICGELGADLTLTETFLRMGVDELSVSPPSVLPLREKVRSLDLSK